MRRRSSFFHSVSLYHTCISFLLWYVILIPHSTSTSPPHRKFYAVSVYVFGGVGVGWLPERNNHFVHAHAKYLKCTMSWSKIASPMDIYDSEFDSRYVRECNVYVWRGYLCLPIVFLHFDRIHLCSSTIIAWITFLTGLDIVSSEPKRIE